MKPTLIALIGKSASGKTAWAERLYNSFDFPGTRDMLISYTTRPPRRNERNGKDYYFTSLVNFMNMKHQHQFLETTYFKGWYYGHKKYSGHADYVIGIFDPSGIKTILTEHRKEFSDVIIIYLYADTFTRLKRMRDREGTWRKEFFRRLLVDKKAFHGLKEMLSRYNCWIISIDTKSDIGYNIYNIQETCEYIKTRRLERERLGC